MNTAKFLLVISFVVTMYGGWLIDKCNREPSIPSGGLFIPTQKYYEAVDQQRAFSLKFKTLSWIIFLIGGVSMLLVTHPKIEKKILNKFQ